MNATLRALLCSVTLALTACLAATAHAQARREVPEFRTFGVPARTTDAEGIDTLLNAYQIAWRTQDARALMQLHAPDVEWINAYARIFRGRQALGEFLEHRLFPAFDPSVSAAEATNMKRISIRYVSHDTAVAHLYTDGTRGPSRNDDEALRRTHIHLVLGRQGDEWQIVHCVIMDAR